MHPIVDPSLRYSRYLKIPGFVIPAIWPPVYSITTFPRSLILLNSDMAQLQLKAPLVSHSLNHDHPCTTKAAGLTNPQSTSLISPQKPRRRFNYRLSISLANPPINVHPDDLSMSALKHQSSTPMAAVDSSSIPVRSRYENTNAIPTSITTTIESKSATHIIPRCKLSSRDTHRFGAKTPIQVFIHAHPANSRGQSSYRHVIHSSKTHNLSSFTQHIGIFINWSIIVIATLQSLHHLSINPTSRAVIVNTTSI